VHAGDVVAGGVEFSEESFRSAGRVRSFLDVVATEIGVDLASVSRCQQITRIVCPTAIVAFAAPRRALSWW